MGIGLTGCTTLGKQAVETKLVLTATPKIPLPGYHLGPPIQNQQEAISAALANLEQSRLHYQRISKVISAEKMRAGHARRQLKEKGVTAFEGRAKDIMVWVVLFEGAWQIIPPNPSHAETPPPLTHGCVYVIMNASDGGNAEVGGFECSPM
ncbi:MAG: hypothetical protein DSY55_04395 [Clostridia bacterium]|nr:MAG: hypothetical protein DSY55_04395 [Clostridia bacterium]